MSTQINTNILKTFILDKVGNGLAKWEAKKLDIDTDDFAAADIDENDIADVGEMLNNNKLYEMFATMYEEEELEASAKDEDKEKEEQTKVPEGQGSATA